MGSAPTRECSLCGDPTDPLGLHELSHTIKEWSDEVERLRGEVARLRVAIKDHLAYQGGDDALRDALSGDRTPTVEEMGGAFEGGPDSVEWLRAQREHSGDSDE